MSKSKPLREALKKRFYPFAQSSGFVRGKATSMYTPFERVIDGKIQFFEIQWDKGNRPRFVINFGEYPSSEKTDAKQPMASGRLQSVNFSAKMHHIS